MEVLPINGASGSTLNTNQPAGTNQSQLLRSAVAAARQLNALNVPDREFAVVRDPASHRFIVVVLDRSTGTVLDQYPPEDILKMLAQDSPSQGKQTGDSAE